MQVSVVGLGYIGLPTAALFTNAGLQVVGVDIDIRRIRDVNQGKSPFHEPGLGDLVRGGVEAGRLRAVQVMEPADAFVIAVATPMKAAGVPDLGAVEAASQSVGKELRAGNLVVLESTVPPGTTLGLVRSALEEQSGLSAGRDFRLAYCAERAIPGNTLYEMVHNDRVVGGLDHDSTSAAMELYGHIVEGTLLPTEVLVAELAKLAENTYRDVNIALANELGRVCESLGANVWDVIALSNRHPRVQLHLPGPGVGGHCIPKDPQFLVAAAPQEARLIALARSINAEQPMRVIRRALAMLEEGKVPRPPRVAMLGVAYRGGVDDVRDTPALPILSGLEAAGVELALHDPYVRHFVRPLVSLEEALRGADLLLLVTDHPEFRELNPSEASGLMRSRLLLDTRSLLRHVHWRDAGFKVALVGDSR